MTSKAIICYENHAESALSIDPSSERAGFVAAAAFDWRSTTYWSPTAAAGTHTLTMTFSAAVTADYVAVYRHNLATCGASIVLQYSTDAGVTWVGAFVALSPSDNECAVKTFSQQAATHWRVVVVTSNASPCFLGVIAFGRKLTTYRGMPPGFVVPRHARKNTILNSVTEGGQWAGRSIIARGAATSIEMQHVDRGWVRAHWEPFLRHAELRPFFFSWNHADHPGDAAFCWLDGELPELPVDGDFLHQVRLPVRCLLSGDF